MQNKQYLLKRISLATVMVVLIALPTALGAIPLKVHTPIGTLSLAADEAVARARNTSNNRLRNLRVINSNQNFTQRFSISRMGYTVNVRENVSRITIAPTRGNSNQSIRHRIETRNPSNQRWSNGSWTRWRSGTSANNRINVNVNQAQERRLRIAVRDRSGNVRSYTVNLRRASTNTTASSLRTTAGQLNRLFSPTQNNYTITLPSNRASTTVSMTRAQANANMRVQVGNGPWSVWERVNPSRNISLTQGGSQTIRFQVRGAFSNVAPSPTRTRTYTITVNRINPNVPQADAQGWTQLGSDRSLRFNRTRQVFEMQTSAIRFLLLNRTGVLRGIMDSGLNWPVKSSLMQ